MAKKRNSRPLIYGGVAVVAIAAFILTGEDSSGGNEAIKSSKAARQETGRSSTRTRSSTAFTDEDYSATFPAVNEAPANAFKPLVVSAKAAGGSGSGSGSQAAPNEIPASFTDGESIWLYTGTASVDGVPMALVENPATSEGEFIKVGQRWKNTVVRKITPTTLVLSGPGGSRTFELLRDPEIDNLIEAETTPLNPLRGDIGRLEASQGETVAEQAKQPEKNNEME